MKKFYIFNLTKRFSLEFHLGLSGLVGVVYLDHMPPEKWLYFHFLFFRIGIWFHPKGPYHFEKFEHLTLY